MSVATELISLFVLSNELSRLWLLQEVKLVQYVTLDLGGFVPEVNYV
jgi:hypothetical protein